MKQNDAGGRCRLGRWASAAFLIGCGLLGETMAPGATNEHTRLYEEPNAENPGGFRGRVVRPADPIRQVLAIPPDAPEEVYQAQIAEPERRSFLFTGLPMRKYDLMVVYDDAFYEGLQLCRGASTLTTNDIGKIEAIVQKSEPFFIRKIIHRVQGETGQGNFSRCLCTFLRDKPSELMWEQFKGEWKRDDYRRTFKLMILKDVGPGWQVVRARDLYPIWTAPAHATPAHHYQERLSGIRVADQVKDIGDLDLAP